MTDESPKNRRTLTEAERAEFLVKLSKLILEYGVSLTNDERDSWFGTLVVADYCGHTLYQTADFDYFDATRILQENGESG